MLKKFAAGLALCLGMTAAALADYPDRPITIVHGWAPGGPADTISRIVGEALSQQLKQPVLIDARPGAGGNVGSAIVAKAKPDGYTLGLLTGAHSTSAGLYKNLTFDPVEDFQPISNIVDYAFVIAVRADDPIKDAGELFAKARAAKEGLSYGTAGTGTRFHLIGQMLNAQLGTHFVHIPYRGDSPAINALLGGEVPMVIGTTTAVAPQVAAGKLRVLAITSKSRWSGMPDVPTAQEAGVTGFEVTTWAGLVAPKDTPAEIVEKLNAATRAVIEIPAIKAKLEQIVGGEVRPSSPENLKKLIATDVPFWTDLIKKVGIQPD